jgi:hypothetical protein
MSNNIPNVPGNWAPPIVYSTPISSRLEELLGDIHLSDGEWEVDLDGMYSAAVAEVADLLPAESLMDYAVAPQILDATNDSYPVTGAKVLYVRRQDNQLYPADDDGNPTGPFYECKEVTIAEFQKANIENSIYSPTIESPIYTVSSNSGDPTVQILPLPGIDGMQPSNAELYLFQYPTAMPVTTTSTIDGMPNQLIMAILLRTATYVLNAYLAWAVHEEEDNEIVALVSAQIQAYQQGYQAEMKRYMEGANE